MGDKMTNLSAVATALIPMAMACPLACIPAAQKPAAPAGKAASNVAGPSAEIDEITLERFGHAPDAPMYEVVLSKDGKVTYTGEFNVAKIGTYEAEIEPRDFRRLKEMINRFRYFDRNDEILVADDADAVRTTVRRAGQTKTIKDGWGSTAPVELWAIEMAIDGLVAGIGDWQKVK